VSKDILEELDYESLRRNFLKYTRRAFYKLPERNSAYILDIGCGSGVPTIELAKLSKGEIIGIDTDQSALNEFRKKINNLGLNNRVKAMNKSLLKLNFPDKSFDIIWAEGVMQFIGFEKALKKWKPLLKLNGNLVLHDDLGGMEEKIKIIPKCGYELVDYFHLPDEAWWVEYYEPLEKRINELRAIHGNDPTFLNAIKRFQEEINAYKANPSRFRSIFYILKKI
jgi:ubiquinone/menaquinone biosynthesis C-methylase UbiE